MPVVVAFDRKPNLQALCEEREKPGGNWKTIGRRTSGFGFIVLETSHGELARDAITENFGYLPSNCIAVVVRSDVSTMVAREDTSGEHFGIASIAGTL